MSTTKVRVIAREVQYDRRGRLKGETFDADERWARAKVLLKQVEIVPGRPFRNADVKPPVTKPEAPAEPARQIDRDVEAEAKPEVAPEPVEAPPPQSRYRTRKLEAE